MRPCRVCLIPTKDATCGVPVHSECLKAKSITVLRVESRYGKPIEEILVSLIKNCPTWSERYAALGVSKVTAFAWVRKFLGKTPQQAVNSLVVKKKRSRGRKRRNSPLQTGLRDYLSSPSSLIIPE